MCKLILVRIYTYVYTCVSCAYMQTHRSTQRRFLKEQFFSSGCTWGSRCGILPGSLPSLGLRFPVWCPFLRLPPTPRSAVLRVELQPQPLAHLACDSSLEALPCGMDEGGTCLWGSSPPSAVCRAGQLLILSEL